MWGYTGREDYNPEAYEKAKERLAEYCRDNNIDTIVSGMALGFDTIGAEVALENNLKLVAAVPFHGQERKWSAVDKERYHNILKQADSVIMVSDREVDDNTPMDVIVKLMNDRNEWMVDNADEVFALWDGTSGGTGNAVNYTDKSSKPITVVRPSDIKLFDNNENIVEESSSTPNVIDSFRGEYAFLSNMYDSFVEHTIWRFRNAEAAFQARKLWHVNDLDNYEGWEEELEAFEKASGKEAKSLGKKVRDLNKDKWDKNRYDEMLWVIREKFSPEFHPDLARKLLDTGDAILIEGNTWGDTYWGVSNGKGENNLGKILMQVREELKNQLGENNG